MSSVQNALIYVLYLYYSNRQINLRFAKMNSEEAKSDVKIFLKTIFYFFSPQSKQMQRSISRTILLITSCRLS